MTAAALAPSLFNTGVGIYQMVEGNRRLNALERPKYDIPPEVYQQLVLSQQEFGARGRQEVQSRVDNELAAANRAIMARDAGMANQSAAAIEAARQRGSNQIAVTADQKRQQDLNRLMASMGQMADQKAQQWQINEFAPYAQSYNEAREMIGGGIQNVSGGLSGISALSQVYMGQGYAPQTATDMSSLTSSQTKGSNAVGSATVNFSGIDFNNPSRGDGNGTVDAVTQALSLLTR